MQNNLTDKPTTMDKNRILHHWSYFLNLEKDFITLTRYIEVDILNFKTYSFELSKILQLSCSEIDTVCRQLCNEIDPLNDYFDDTTKSGNIALYKKVIFKKFPMLPNSIINIPKLQIDIYPWLDWKTIDSPNWWTNYNKVKHYRHSCFDKANLESVIYSLSALMVLILYLFRYSENKPFSNPNIHSEYFSCDYCSPLLKARSEKELPDFE